MRKKNSSDDPAEAPFRRDPLGFVQSVFPWRAAGTALAGENGPRDWQRERLEEIGRHLQASTKGGAADGALRLAVASGHGIGKSALVAWVVLWALATFPMTRVSATMDHALDLAPRLRALDLAEIEAASGRPVIEVLAGYN